MNRDQRCHCFLSPTEASQSLLFTHNMYRISWRNNQTNFQGSKKFIFHDLESAMANVRDSNCHYPIIEHWVEEKGVGYDHKIRHLPNKTVEVDQTIDFDVVKKAVTKAMTKLDTRLTYHSWSHTVDEVLPRVCSIMGHLLCKQPLAHNPLTLHEELLIVKTAALFHDTGFIDRYKNNEEMGCKRARHMLPQFGYKQHQVDRICNCIMATKMPQSPGDNLLARILCDADLAYLGTDSFLKRAEDLRLERNAILGTDCSEEGWREQTIEFLKNHSFFTQAAKELFDEQKQKHLKSLLMQQRLKEVK